MRQEQEAKFANSLGSCPKFYHSEVCVYMLEGEGEGRGNVVKLQSVTLCARFPGISKLKSNFSGP